MPQQDRGDLVLKETVFPCPKTFPSSKEVAKEGVSLMLVPGPPLQLRTIEISGPKSAGRTQGGWRQPGAGQRERPEGWEPQPREADQKARSCLV